MTNRNTTKRSLVSSALAMLMCVAMLVGTTFAWFTDTATTSVNKIQAGTLDVGLEYKTSNDTWVSAEGQTLAWVDKDSSDLWEPGCTYTLPELRVVNKGNLALKYKVVISGINGDAKLNEAIDWTINFGGTETAVGSKEYYLLPANTTGDTITISGHMKEDAGNEYQGLSIDGISITVYATQYTSEYDSFNNTYDGNAEFAIVEDQASFAAALNAGKNVALADDIVLTAPLTISSDVEIAGNGNAVISAQPVNVAPTADVIFTDVNFATPDNSNDNASSVYASGLEGKVVFDGCTFTNPQWECIQITPKDGAEIIVTNCTFIVDGTATYAKDNGTKVERMLHIQNTAANGNYTVTVTNNKFIGVDKVYNSVIDIDDIAAFANVTCGANTFLNHDNSAVSTLAEGLIYVNIKGHYDAANVATDTYTQFTQATPAALHY